MRSGIWVIFIASTVFVPAGAVYRKSMFPMAAILLVAGSFAINLDPRYYAEWYFNARDKSFLQTALAIRKGGAMSVSGDFEFGPTVNFYRRIWKIAGMSEYATVEPRYLLLHQLHREQAARLGMMVVAEEPLCKCLLAALD